MQAAKHLIERYLLLWLVMLSCLAFFWNRLAPVDVFAALKPVLPLLIVITMFAIGWMLTGTVLARAWALGESRRGESTGAEESPRDSPADNR